MDVNILCPKCYQVLTDRFSAPKCTIGVDETYHLTLECCHCEEYFDVTITLKNGLLEIEGPAIKCVYEVENEEEECSCQKPEVYDPFCPVHGTNEL